MLDSQSSELIDAYVLVGLLALRVVQIMGSLPSAVRVAFSSTGVLQVGLFG